MKISDSRFPANAFCANTSWFMLCVIVAFMLSACASEKVNQTEKGRPLPPDSREVEMRDVNYQIESGTRTGAGGVYR